MTTVTLSLSTGGLSGSRLRGEAMTRTNFMDRLYLNTQLSC